MEAELVRGDRALLTERINCEKQKQGEEAG